MWISICRQRLNMHGEKKSALRRTLQDLRQFSNLMKSHTVSNQSDNMNTIEGRYQ